MRMLVFLAFLLLASFPARAEEKPDLATLQSQADAGDADAQYALGMRYLNGDGVERNKTEGYFWGCLSERCSQLQFFCAESVTNQPLPEHWEIMKRIKAWRPAATLDLLARAEEGHLPSQYKVAQLYLSGGDCKGKGPFEQSDAEALFWFSLVVARQGAGHSREDTMMIEDATAARRALIEKMKLKGKDIKALNDRLRAWKPAR